MFLRINPTRFYSPYIRHEHGVLKTSYSQPSKTRLCFQDRGDKIFFFSKIVSNLVISFFKEKSIIVGIGIKIIIKIKIVSE